MAPDRQTGTGSGIPARIWRRTAAALAAAITVIAAAWSLGVPRMLGVSYYPQQFLAVILALTLAVAFMTITPSRTKREGPLPWYDAVAAALGFAACAYIAFDYAAL